MTTVTKKISGGMFSGSSEDDFTAKLKFIDMHVIVEAMGAYVNGGYKGDNMDHLQKARDVYNVFIEAYIAKKGGTFTETENS